jgi:hypothetical protein
LSSLWLVLSRSRTLSNASSAVDCTVNPRIRKILAIRLRSDMAVGLQGDCAK